METVKVNGVTFTYTIENEATGDSEDKYAVKAEYDGINVYFDSYGENGYVENTMELDDDLIRIKMKEWLTEEQYFEYSKYQDVTGFYAKKTDTQTFLSDFSFDYSHDSLYDDYELCGMMETVKDKLDSIIEYVVEQWEKYKKLNQNN